MFSYGHPFKPLIVLQCSFSYQLAVIPHIVLVQSYTCTFASVVYRSIEKYLHGQRNIAGPKAKIHWHPARMAQPNLLGFGLLVPPNFNLVASFTTTTFERTYFPSLPSSAFCTASRPGPHPLNTTSSCVMILLKPLSCIVFNTNAAS